MQTFLPHHRRALSTGTVLVGAFLLYWSVAALLSASHTPDAIPTVDTFLGSIGWIWLTGLGTFLVPVGSRRFLLALARRSRGVSIAISGIGIAFVAAQFGFVALSLSSVGGAILFSPILGVGGPLLLIGVTDWNSTGEVSR